MKNQKRNLAWHFVGKKLRDGSPVPADGEWLEYKGPLKMCKSGLHFSRDPFDALQYAPGETLCLVEIRGGWIGGEEEGFPRRWQEPIEGVDKGVAHGRRIIARMDATELLRYFARMQALSVIHLNEDLCGIETVVDYLMTGDESLRIAARIASRKIAWSATMAAAWYATWATAWGARATILYAMDITRYATWGASDAARDDVRKEFNDLVRECFEDFL